MKLKHLFLVMLGATALLRADDGAAEIANGGLRARHETRVAMVWERLDLSLGAVKVAFRFLNTSKEEVVTEVAFPWPDYEFSYGMRTWDPSMLTFTAIVDGKDQQVKPDIRATLNGKDVTSELQRLGIDIAQFGRHEDLKADRADPSMGCQICSNAEIQASLLREGLIEADDNTPKWKVSLRFHWTQRFPPGKEVFIEHSYKPILGEQALGEGGSENQGHEMADFINHPFEGESRDSGCADGSFEHQANRTNVSQRTYGMGVSWLRYILTSANTWQGPIGDFEMIVHRPKGRLVTFCWDGPVEKRDADTFVARAKNFRPSREVTVYFF